MYCRYCGNALPDGAAFCPSCGQPVQQAQAQPQQPQQPQQSYRQPQQGYQQPQQGYQPPVYQIPNPYGEAYFPQPVLGMKWHKFLVYFALWAGAVGYLIVGIITLTGSHYGSNRDLVYTYIPEMKVPDTVYGIVLLGTAVFSVLTALSLLRFKAAGPKNLTMLYIIEMAGTAVYSIWSISVLSSYGGDTGDVVANLVGALVGGVIGIVINKVYYGKRAHLFVN